MSYGNAKELFALALFMMGRKNVSLSGIQERFSCQRRQAQRMLTALADLFPDMERTVEGGRFAFWRLPNTTRLPIPNLTADEMVALVRASQILERDASPEEVNAMRKVIDLARFLMPRKVTSSIEVDEEALLECSGLAARPGPRPAINSELMEQVSFALKACRLIEFDYQGGIGSIKNYRNISPYGLLIGTRRYLIGKSKENLLSYRHYRLDRIKNLKICEEVFVRDVKFNLQEYARRGFGSFINDSEYEQIIWRFSPIAAPNALGFIFHPDQEMQLEDDGHLLVSFRTSGYLEMAWHLYSWGDHVEVLTPEKLKILVERYRRSDFPALP